MNIRDVVRATDTELQAATSRRELANEGYTIHGVGGGAHSHTARPGDIPIDPNLALSLTAVYACVGRIGNPLSIFPVEVFKKTSTRDEPQVNHQISNLFNRRANRFMTGRTLRKTGTTGSLLWGNGYVEIERKRSGEPNALWPLLPWNTYAHRIDDRLFQRTQIDGKSFDIPDEDCLHVMDLTLDGYNGVSPIEQAAHSVGLSLAAEDFGGKFFTNDAKSGGFIMIPGRLSAKGQQNVSDSMNEQGGLNNAHRIKVLEDGAKFINTSIPPDAAQFLGTREFQLAEIARLYNVPLFMLQSESGSTKWGTGIEQLAIGFVQYTLQPWVNAWETEINTKMLTPREQAEGYFVKFNMDELLRGDSAARAAFYQNGILTGWLNRNEARIAEGREAVEGLDEYLIPVNMTTSDRLGEVPAADSGQGEDESK